MSVQSTTRIFVSYTSSDLPWAEWIAWELKAKGYETKLAAWHFRPGQDFIAEMHKATTEADFILAVLSPEYLNAIYTQDEWSVGFVRDNADERGRLIPVRVKEFKPHGLFSSRIYIDFVDLTDVECSAALLKGLEPGGPPKERPFFPGPRSVFPGVLPAVWNIPHNRNDQFRGREVFLADLHKALTSRRRSAWTQALVGAGGVGKTQIAIEYAYSHQADYKVVWWLRTDALPTDFGSLARALHCTENQSVDPVLIRQSVRELLEQSANWLLIFDEAKNPAELRDYIPKGGGGHVLITSRNPHWDGLAQVSKVGPLEGDAARDILLSVGEAA